MFSKVGVHCKGANYSEKLIESNVELASVCIQMSNIPRAVVLLKKAQSLLEVS